MASIEPMDCILYLVSRLSLVITSAVKRCLNEAGLGQVKPAYLWALLSLWAEDGLKVTDIARQAGLDTSTMTGLLDRMERDALVVRKTDASDRRTLRIFLTDEGRRIRKPVIAQTLKVLDQCTAGIPQADLDVTHATLAKVLSRVREEAP
jgi:DNA-binding MarR family transcriptional regulator